MSGYVLTNFLDTHELRLVSHLEDGGAKPGQGGIPLRVPCCDLIDWFFLLGDSAEIEILRVVTPIFTFLLKTCTRHILQSGFTYNMTNGHSLTKVTSKDTAGL